METFRDKADEIILNDDNDLIFNEIKLVNLLEKGEFIDDEEPIIDDRKLDVSPHLEISNKYGEIIEDNDIPRSTQNIIDSKVTEELCLNEALSIEGQVEAVIFASPKPIKSVEIYDIVHQVDDCVQQVQIDAALRRLVRSYEERGGGFKLENFKSEGFQFRTVECAAVLMEKLFASRPRPLSRAAFETLAIIAYKQPVTRAEIENVRAVDAGSIIKNLLDRDLIKCVGRKEDAGRPMVFGTTEEFLRVFKVKNLSELPPLSSFQPSLDIMKKAKEPLQNLAEDVDVEPFVSGEINAYFTEDASL